MRVKDGLIGVNPTLNINPTEYARYKPLSDALQNVLFYEILGLNSFVPTEPWRKYTYLKNLKVKFQCTRYTHMSGNTGLHFVWKISELDDQTEVLNKSTTNKETLMQDIPLYHTRARRRDFINSFGSVCHVKSHVLREAYRRLQAMLQLEIIAHRKKSICVFAKLGICVTLNYW